MSITFIVFMMLCLSSERSFSMETRNLESSQDQLSDVKCSKTDILIKQGLAAELPRGIPMFLVEIVNRCSCHNCNVSQIHVSCGWFSSARLINPKLFRRIAYDDCLVNDGHPLVAGDLLRFKYSSTKPFPLSVSSLLC